MQYAVCRDGTGERTTVDISSQGEVTFEGSLPDGVYLVMSESNDVMGQFEVVDGEPSLAQSHHHHAPVMMVVVRIPMGPPTWAQMTASHVARIEQVYARLVSSSCSSCSTACHTPSIRDDNAELTQWWQEEAVPFFQRTEPILADLHSNGRAPDPDSEQGSGLVDWLLSFFREEELHDLVYFGFDSPDQVADLLGRLQRLRGFQPA